MNNASRLCSLPRRFLLSQHRDLKLENILIETSAEGGGAPSVKLVDFGLSAIFEENAMSTDVLGSWVRAHAIDCTLESSRGSRKYRRKKEKSYGRKKAVYEEGLRTFGTNSYFGRGCTVRFLAGQVIVDTLCRWSFWAVYR